MKAPCASARREIASVCGVDDQFLYQCLTGRRQMDAKDAVRVESRSDGRIRRWQLRQKDWHEVWPELIGAEGAPAVAQPEAPHAG